MGRSMWRACNVHKWGRVPGLLAVGVASCRARDLCLSCGLEHDEKEGVTGERVRGHQESGEVSVLIG